MKPLFTFLLVVFVLAADAQTFQLADYLPLRIGDSLQLQNMLGEKLPPLVITYPDTIRFRGLPVVRRIENGGKQTLERLDAKGWQWFTIGLDKTREMILESPIMVLPASVEQGENHVWETTYALLENKQKRGGGKIRIEIKVEGNDSSRTPLQNFADCLVFTTTVIRSPTGSPAEGYTIKEWYARDIGLIKAAGEVFAMTSSGKRQSKGRIALMLERAVIKGKIMENPKN